MPMNVTSKADHHESQFLDGFGRAYFDHVLAEYELWKPLTSRSISDSILRIADENRLKPEERTWKDLYELEEFVLTIQPDDVVKARAPGLEHCFREVKGEELYTEYLALRKAQKGNSHLRTDLGRLLEDLHFTYCMIPAREKMRTDILKDTGKRLLASLAVLVPLVVVAASMGQTLWATFGLVAIMGALGGFFSLQRRMQNIPGQRDPLLTMLELKNGQFTVSLAPLIGAVFAIVLFLMFLGGLVSGKLFPDNLSFPHWKFWEPIVGGAAQMENYGKLLLWSFIAGFAEKFVPDTLDTIALKGRAAATANGKVVSSVEIRNRPAADAGNSKKKDEGKRLVPAGRQ